MVIKKLYFFKLLALEFFFLIYLVLFVFIDKSIENNVRQRIGFHKMHVTKIHR